MVTCYLKMFENASETVLHVEHPRITVNPFYNDIRYNSMFCYNVNSVCTKIADRDCFHWQFHVIFRKTHVLDIF